MPKPRRYYYECVEMVDVIHVGPDMRRERWPRNTLSPPSCEHSYRFLPADEEIDRPPDYLVTDRQLAEHFTEPQEKQVERRNLRTGEKEMRSKTTKVLFRLLEPGEVTESVVRGAKSLNLREQDLKPIREKVTA